MDALRLRYLFPYPRSTRHTSQLAPDSWINDRGADNILLIPLAHPNRLQQVQIYISKEKEKIVSLSNLHFCVCV